jgi:hypothetical protein
MASSSGCPQSTSSKGLAPPQLLLPSASSPMDRSNRHGPGIGDLPGDHRPSPGRLTAESSPTEGSKFTVWLPALRSRAASTWDPERRPAPPCHRVWSAIELGACSSARPGPRSRPAAPTNRRSSRFLIYSQAPALPPGTASLAEPFRVVHLPVSLGSGLPRQSASPGGHRRPV